MLHDLRWLGIAWDEGRAFVFAWSRQCSRHAQWSMPNFGVLLPLFAGPDIGGPNGPYRQSERKHIYGKCVDQLVEKGLAYPCFCTDDELKQ